MTVQTLMDQLIIRLSAPPVMSIIDAVNQATLAAFKRLLVLRSDLIMADYLLDYGTGDVPAAAALPRRFYGLVGKPHLVGGNELEPLPPDRASALVGDTGTPQYYRLRKNQLQIFPAPIDNIAVMGEAFIRPEVVTVLSDELPLNGMIDEVLREVCLRLLSGTLAVDRELEAFVSAQLDMILPQRDHHLPAERGVRYF